MLTKELNSWQNFSMFVPKTRISAFQNMKHCNKNSSLSASDIKLLKKTPCWSVLDAKIRQEPIPYELVAKVYTCCMPVKSHCGCLVSPPCTGPCDWSPNPAGSLQDERRSGTESPVRAGGSERVQERIQTPGDASLQVTLSPDRGSLGWGVGVCVCVNKT